MRWNPWHGLRGLPREMWVLFGATLINRAGTMVMPFLALYLIREREISAGRTGIALAAYGLGALITAPIAGRLTDRLTPMRVMSASLLGAGMMAILLPRVPGFAGFVAATFVWAVIAEAYRPANLVAVSDMVPADQRRAAFALMRLAINLGMSVGPLVAGLLAAVSFELLFWVDGLTSLAAGCVLLLSAKRWRRTGDQQAPAVILEKGPSPLRDRRYLYFLAAVVPVVAVFFQIQGALAIQIVENLRFSEAAYGVLLAINTALIVGTEVPLNLRLARTPARRSLVAGSLLIAVGFGAYGVTDTLPLLYAATVVWTAGEMLLFSALPAAAAELSPPARRGDYMGLFQMAFSLAFVVGPWAGTAALAKYGPLAMWGGAAAVAAVSAILFSGLRLPPAAAPLGTTAPEAS